MSAPAPSRSSRPAARDRDNLIARSLPICWLCEQPIDTTLPGDHDSGQGASLHHAWPLTLRPDLEHDPDNHRLTHLTCNKIAGELPPDHAPTYVRQRLGLNPDPTPHTRDWGI